ncbi:hypothetical protein, partial [Staphylococcus capitis]
ILIITKQRNNIKPNNNKKGAVAMAVIHELIDEANITITETALSNLTYVILKTEVDANNDPNTEDFGLTNIYLDHNDEMNLVFTEGMQQHETVIQEAELDQLSDACTQDELGAMAQRVEVDIT